MIPQQSLSRVYYKHLASASPPVTPATLPCNNSSLCLCPQSALIAHPLPCPWNSDRPSLPHSARRAYRGMYPSIPANYATYPSAGSQAQNPPPPPVAYANTTTFRPPQQPGYAPQPGPPTVNPQEVLSSIDATSTLRIRLAEEYKIAPPVRLRPPAPPRAPIAPPPPPPPPLPCWALRRCSPGRRLAWAPLDPSQGPAPLLPAPPVNPAPRHCRSRCPPSATTTPPR
jgi:Wiskott-Aldrich syndrome protein